MVRVRSASLRLPLLMMRPGDAGVERAEPRVTGIATRAADMLDDEQPATVFRRAEQELAGIDLLITIIGQGSFNPITEMTTEQWDRDHRMNLRYFFINAQLAARSLITRGPPRPAGSGSTRRRSR